jgi:hypothetical protein
METIMSTEKKGETAKQKPKPSEPVAKTTKKGEIKLSAKELAGTTGGAGELSEKALARTTGGGKPIHKEL